MGYNSKYRGEEVENLLDRVSGGLTTTVAMSMSGTVNVAVAEGKTTIEGVYSKLKANEMAYLMVTDSAGNLPSLSGEGSVTMESSVAQLFNLSGDALGVSVGDIVAVIKVKVLLVDVMVCQVIPLNDAKAADGAFPGAMGLESPWDKQQVNRVPGLADGLALVNAPTRDGTNMNDCLAQGFYPWCTLGRPEGSTGAYTLVVRKSTTADFNDYYTIEQTAYGREGDELGQVWKRLIFKPLSGRAEYMDWVRVDDGGAGKLGNMVYYCPGTLSSLTNNSTAAQIEEVLGDATTFMKAAKQGTTFVSADGSIAGCKREDLNEYQYILTSFHGNYIRDIGIILGSINNSDPLYDYVIVNDTFIRPEDSLSSSNELRPLSANQGRVLDEKIQAQAQKTQGIGTDVRIGTGGYVNIVGNTTIGYNTTIGTNGHVEIRGDTTICDKVFIDRNVNIKGKSDGSGITISIGTQTVTLNFD